MLTAIKLWTQNNLFVMMYILQVFVMELQSRRNDCGAL